MSKHNHKNQNRNEDSLQIQQPEQIISNQNAIQDGWWSTTTNWMQKLDIFRKKKYFNGTHLLDMALNDEKSDDISLFGMNFKSNDQARILYSSVLWFTYRENLKFYKINPQFTTKTDVGWGCMIRVGQMMLAHCLRLNLGTKYFDDEAQLKKLLNEFISHEGKFSVQNIAQKAFELFGLKPGEWYSPNQIAHVLSDLQNSNKESKLKVIVYDNEFEWSKALQFLDQNRAKNQKVMNSKKNYIKDNILNLNIDPGLIIILFRIGYKTCQPQLLEVVINFLKSQRNCIGILGGRPGRAHYIFGTTDKSFIYLDPHCVKDNDQIDSFFSPSIFSIPHQNIDPSMGLCFYIRNTAQLLRLYDKFQSFKKNLPFYSYSKCEIPMIVEKQEVEEEFQKLQFESSI